MPVTTMTRAKLAGKNTDEGVKSSEELIMLSCKHWTPKISMGPPPSPNPKKRPIVNSSFADVDGTGNRNTSSNSATERTLAFGNGFVHGMLRAFEQNCHVIIRPDDFWLAILTQYALYINTNSQELSRLFVTDVETKKLLKCPLSSQSVEALDMSEIIQKNSHDPTLRGWMLPVFSTTTINDRTVAAVVFMGALQPYFDYAFVPPTPPDPDSLTPYPRTPQIATIRYLSRGVGATIDKVMAKEVTNSVIKINKTGKMTHTLTGEKEDWQRILNRIQSLRSVNEDLQLWARQLIPVLNRIILSYTMPKSPDVKRLWVTPIHFDEPRGGISTGAISGWMSVFCYWPEEGSREHVGALHDLSGNQFGLQLDDVWYDPLSESNITRGGFSVPATVMGVGLKEGCDIPVTIMAGSFGMTVSAVNPQQSRMRPRSGWVVFDDSILVEKSNDENENVVEKTTV